MAHRCMEDIVSLLSLVGKHWLGVGLGYLDAEMADLGSRTQAYRSHAEALGKGRAGWRDRLSRSQCQQKRDVFRRCHGRRKAVDYIAATAQVGVHEREEWDS